MDHDHKTTTQNFTNIQSTNAFRPPNRFKIRMRRRKRPTARLGGKKPRRRIFLVRLFRRVRLRWLNLNHSFEFKKLMKQYYRSLVRDIVEAGKTIESVQQRILMEASFAVPVMGLSFNGFHNASGRF
ncbi:hypothetical protein U1Q18_006378 [Sarracenia purpurea var. burkii]